MQGKVKAIVEFWEDHLVDIDNASMYCGGYHDKKAYDYTFTFDHGQETRANFQAVKRAIGNFDKTGDGPSMVLHGAVEVAQGVEKSLKVQVKWESAYECKVSYNCSPKGFKDEKDSTLPSVGTGF